jgi:DNA invertase Pin-like site-specific DNA recombinase
VICAIYARKANEQEKGASGATDSCERQIEHAKAFAASRGWTIEPEFIYVDDQISGAEISKLKARARMVADADAGKFSILVVCEQKSLGRGEIIETCTTIKTIADAGVRIFEYLTGTGISVEDEIAQVMTMLRGFASASERRQASRRVYDASVQRVRAGYVAGAKAIGGRDAVCSAPPARRFAYRRVCPTGGDQTPWWRHRVGEGSCERVGTRSRALHGWESSRTGHRDGSTSRGFRSVDV